jgi:DNA-binding NtrC family response regulator
MAPPAPPPELAPLAARAAAADCPLLIIGETGVGKGRLAEWVHFNSPRRNRPFVPVNCGAIPHDLIDSQLFGHARGSFTGATSEHLGLVRAANGGTLLLDEVSELPASAQTRLLRLLQEREAQPVGYCQPLQVDVRVIAATNIDLHRAVTAGRFREDLYYRLDIVRLELKPLRHRAAEVPGLVERFNAEFAAMYHAQPLRFTRAALRVLERHPWPGNIRQLRAVLERLHVLGAGREVTPDDLGHYGQLTSEPLPAAPLQWMQQARVDVVNQALAASGGNVSRAAAALGVHRSTIYRWLAEQAISA